MTKHRNQNVNRILELSDRIANDEQPYQVPVLLQYPVVSSRLRFYDHSHHARTYHCSSRRIVVEYFLAGVVQTPR